MKKILFALLLPLFSISILGQDMRNVFSIDKIDEFTGDTIIATKGVVLHRSLIDAFASSIKYSNGNYFLICSQTTGKCYNLYENQSLFYIKFSDGSIRKAICQETKVADYTIIANITSWGATAIYLPENGFIEDLATKDIVKYRYETSLGYFEKEVSGKKAKEFKRQASALLTRVTLGSIENIETKYKDGEYVWIIKKGKPRNYEIGSTEIRKDGIYYMLNQRNSWDKIECKESMCYPTKEEAINAEEEN